MYINNLVTSEKDSKYIITSEKIRSKQEIHTVTGKRRGRRREPDDTGRRGQVMSKPSWIRQEVS